MPLLLVNGRGYAVDRACPSSGSGGFRARSPQMRPVDRAQIWEAGAVYVKEWGTGRGWLAQEVFSAEHCGGGACRGGSGVEVCTGGY